MDALAHFLAHPQQIKPKKQISSLLDALEKCYHRFNMNILISLPWKSMVFCCLVVHMSPWLFSLAPIHSLTCSRILGPALIFLIKCFPAILLEVSLQDTCVPTRSQWHSQALGDIQTKKPHSSIRRSQNPHLYADDNKLIKPLQLIKT